MSQHNQSCATDALWQWATGTYERTGVASACLALQDDLGVDVNLLLYAAWQAARGVRLEGDDVRELELLCRPWREAVIEPLRRQRQAWNALPDRETEYRAIKALELAAERAQLDRLASGLARRSAREPSTHSGSLAGAASPLEANLLAVLTLSADPLPAAALQPLLAALRPGA